LVVEWEEDELLMLAELSSEDNCIFKGAIRDPRISHPVGEMEGHLYQSLAGDYAFWVEMHYDDTGYGGHYMIHLVSKSGDY